MNDAHEHMDALINMQESDDFFELMDTIDAPTKTYQQGGAVSTTQLFNQDLNNDGVVDVLDAVGGQEQGWTDNALQMLVNQIIPPTGGTEGGGFTHPGGAVSPPSGGGFGEPTPNYNPYNPATPVTGAGQYLVPPAVGAQSISPGEKPVSFADEGPSTWDYNGDGFIDLLDIWAAMQAGASQEYIQNIQGWIGGGGIATPPGPPAPGSGTGMNITPGEGPTGYNELGGGSVVVNVYSDVGRKITEAEAGIRIEIEDRANRNNQFPALLA